jgi:hypothetical protein
MMRGRLPSPPAPMHTVLFAQARRQVTLPEIDGSACTYRGITVRSKKSL